MDAKSKIDSLQYKLLNKLEVDDSRDDDAFYELLSLCKNDISEILDRMRKQVSSDDVEEKLREEILEGVKQRNDIKTTYESEMYDLKQDQ